MILQDKLIKRLHFYLTLIKFILILCQVQIRDLSGIHHMLNRWNHLQERRRRRDRVCQKRANNQGK